MAPGLPGSAGPITKWPTCGTTKEYHVRLLIAIPVHNELKYVDHVLDRVLRYHDHVLVVDDGSTDGTSDILRRRSDVHVIRHPVNRGYGRSLIDAFAYADAHDYDWVITMDCDEQHEPEMIPRFIAAIESTDADIISGSRYLGDHNERDLPPGDRRRINASITSVLNKLFEWDLTDAFCGFKAHRVAAMRRLNLDEPGYAFPMQLWPQAWRQKLTVREVPVRLIYNDPNRSFGAVLDDPGVRLKHYLDVLARELDHSAPSAAPAASTADAFCGCGCCG